MYREDVEFGFRFRALDLSEEVVLPTFGLLVDVLTLSGTDALLNAVLEVFVE